jgi:fluoride exporter
MINLYQIFIISIFAALGAIFRYVLVLAYPFNHNILNGVLLANVIGCFMMGILLYLVNQMSFMNDTIRLGLIVGFVGSLTTFSSFGGYFFELFEGRHFAKAFLHVLVTTSLSLASLFIGYWLISQLSSRFFN